MIGIEREKEQEYKLYLFRGDDYKSIRRDAMKWITRLADSTQVFVFGLGDFKKEHFGLNSKLFFE